MKRYATWTLALACCASLASAPALAAEQGGPPEHPPGRGPMAHEHGGPPPGHGPAFLSALALSEAQQQKVFAIMHAQEPQRWQQMNAQRKAMDALRALGESDRYDDAEAVRLAQAAGKASEALGLNEARVAAQIWSLLTTEQRALARAGASRTTPPR